MATLTGAGGAIIRVLDGCIWITNAQTADARPFYRGAEYRVADDGPVLIEQGPLSHQGAMARISISRAAPLPGLVGTLAQFSAGGMPP